MEEIYGGKMKDLTGIIIVGIIAILAIIFTGKMMSNQQTITPQACQPSNPVYVAPAQTTYPYYYPQYHSNHDFWIGYADGWNGYAANHIGCYEYKRGFEIGRYDRRCGKHYYYDHHCPPGVHIKVPGFRLNIR
jgi:hypothetical protein